MRGKPRLWVVYYESIKPELKIRGIYECRCDERLHTKTKEFTRLTYTGLVVELEHLKIETRLIDEMVPSVMGEYVFLKCRRPVNVTVNTTGDCVMVLFIIRVKRELKRVYGNGCRYNERLNAETGGSKTPRIHWVARVNIQ